MDVENPIQTTNNRCFTISLLMLKFPISRLGCRLSFQNIIYSLKHNSWQVIAGILSRTRMRHNLLTSRRMTGKTVKHALGLTFVSSPWFILMSESFFFPQVMGIRKISVHPEASFLPAVKDTKRKDIKLFSERWDYKSQQKKELVRLATVPITGWLYHGVMCESGVIWFATTSCEYFTGTPLWFSVRRNVPGRCLAFQPNHISITLLYTESCRGKNHWDQEQSEIGPASFPWLPDGWWLYLQARHFSTEVLFTHPRVSAALRSVHATSCSCCSPFSVVITHPQGSGWMCRA